MEILQEEKQFLYTKAEKNANESKILYKKIAEI